MAQPKNAGAVDTGGDARCPPFRFPATPSSDFGMTPPDIAGFVQVEDEATLEVLLSLVKA